MSPKLKVILLTAVLVLASCGSLKLSPQGCKSSGYWGAGPARESLKESEQELKFDQDYYVFMGDREIRLRDFLKEKGMQCEDVKKIRVQMGSVFFVKRTLSVFVIK